VPAVVPQVKARIARVTVAECRALAQQALTLSTAEQVRELLAAQETGP
jgi:phosphoenolpyruvate-protein kinase (PTS system EI component)